MNQSADAAMKSPTARLSRRQAQCLELAGQGYTSKEIGRFIGLSPSTVDNHISAAVDRLGARNRTEAVRFLLPRPDVGQDELELISKAGSPSLAAGAFVAWRKLPPLGGKPNRLSRSERLLGMFQIALVGVAASAAIILTIAGVVHVLR